MNATPTTPLGRPNTSKDAIIIQDLGPVSIQDVVNEVLPTLLQQRMGREEQERFLDCLRRQLFEPLETCFRATAVARIQALEGTSIEAGPKGNLADRYGIRNRGIVLRTEGDRTYVLKLFRYREAWSLFVSLFDEQALAEEELRRAFQPAHQPRGDYRNGRRAA